MKTSMQYLLMVLAVLTSLQAHCQIRLHRLYSDHAVLQRDRPITIAGWASPGESITLTFQNENWSAVTNSSGIWKITVPAQKAGGPYDLVFRGKNEVIVKDILFGDVWLCSGQSNMEMMVNNVKDKYRNEIATSKNDQIRHFAVPQQYDFRQPHENLDGGEWTAADPEKVLRFSAVAYFFARELYEKYHVPIGLVNASLGGSPAEAWMSADALADFPNHLNEAKRFTDDSLIKQIESDDQKRIGTWYQELNRRDAGITNGWKLVGSPGTELEFAL